MNLIERPKSYNLFVGHTNTQGAHITFDNSFAITTAAIRITSAYGHISLTNSGIGCLKKIEYSVHWIVNMAYYQILWLNIILLAEHYIYNTYERTTGGAAGENDEKSNKKTKFWIHFVH